LLRSLVRLSGLRFGLYAGLCAILNNLAMRKSKTTAAKTTKTMMLIASHCSGL
jgi:hypothetical protein